MGRITLITGGARSGKSRYAETLPGDARDVLYIATAQVYDDEMKERVRLHKQRRPAHWQTHEGHRDLGRLVAQCDGFVLLDCITLLVTALMLEMECDWEQPTNEQVEAGERVILGQIEELLRGAERSRAELICVSNEVGMGLVPPYPMGRVFRDYAGRVNQRIAHSAQRVLFMVSGLPLTLKEE